VLGQTIGTGEVESGITLDTEWDSLFEIEAATSRDIIDSTENSDSDDDLSDDDLGALSNVTITSWSTGEYLRYNGTALVDAAITAADIGDVDAFSQSGTYASLRAQATTKDDVGLGNVPNTDVTNASNISSGTLSIDRYNALTDLGGGTGATYLQKDGSWTTPTDTQLSQEEVDAYIDALINDADSVHTLVEITYDDTDNAMDFVVDDDLSHYDNTTSGFTSGSVADGALSVNVSLLGQTIGTGEVESGITLDTEWDSWAEHPSLSSGYLLVGNVSNEPAAVAMSGDINIDNLGATTIQANVVDFSEIADSLTLDATTNINLFDGAADQDFRYYNSNSSDELLFLDGSNGYVGIGTTSPGAQLEIGGGGTSKLSNTTGDITIDPAGNNVLPGSHNADALGSDSVRWADIYAVNSHFGDINFANQFAITEAMKYDANPDKAGLIFIDGERTELMRLDEYGNLMIAGGLQEGEKEEEQGEEEEDPGYIKQSEFQAFLEEGLDILGIKAEDPGVVKESGFVAVLKNSLEGLGLSVQDQAEEVIWEIKEAMLKVAKLIVGKLEVGSKEEPTGITMYDKETGKPYCVFIENGETKTVAGDCEEAMGKDTNQEETVIPPASTPIPEPTTEPAASATPSAVPDGTGN